MAGERRPRAGRSLFLSVLVVALAWPVVVSGAVAQPREKAPSRGPSYVEKVTRLLQRDFQLPRYPAQGRIECENGFAGPYPCKEFDLMSHVTLAQMGGTRGNDIWGWADPVTDQEWALMGMNNGTAFVDVTDPENPVVIGRLPTHTFNSSWRDIKVFNDHAFVVADNAGAHGMQVFDLTHLRTAPPGTIFPEDAHYPGFANSHNININEDTGFAYAVGSNTCAGGLHMVNINDPSNPQFAGCVSSDGYTHDTQCVIYQGPDAEHRGQEICFSSNEDTLTIVNVTNKAAPVQLSRTPYPGSAYTHQGWLKPDQTLFALDDELDEQRFGHNTRTRFFDVTNLEAPFISFIFDGPTPAIDHNLYWLRDHVFQSNYRAGLRLLFLPTGGVHRVRERGYFDVHPANDLPQFNGSWSNYPFLPSRNILVSSIEEGLFVLQFSGLTPP
ncbi:MAG: choice-of-anchor B family protein [Actinomycetota bacterium]